MSWIVPFVPTLAEHAEKIDGDRQRYRPTRCPHPDCGLSGRLRRHGYYLRKPDRGSRKLNPVKMQRYLCYGCGHTCSSLPSCLSPRRWYLWAVQAAVLIQLLAGGSVHACAREHGPDRRTVRRWWRWLQDSHARFADQLKRRIPDLGRTADWREFWRRCLSDELLQEVMAWLHSQGVSVP